MLKTKTENIKNYASKIYSNFSPTGKLKGKNHQSRCTFNSNYAWLSGAIRAGLPEDALSRVYDFFYPGPRAGKRLIWDELFLIKVLDQIGLHLSDVTHES